MRQFLVIVQYFNRKIFNLWCCYHRQKLTINKWNNRDDLVNFIDSEHVWMILSYDSRSNSDHKLSFSPVMNYQYRFSQRSI